MAVSLNEWQSQIWFKKIYIDEEIDVRQGQDAS